METNKTFTLFWQMDKSEIVTGDNVADAMCKAGYGAGATKALDFYAIGDKRSEYQWNYEKKKWDKVEQTITK